jgi:hypothetical protein
MTPIRRFPPISSSSLCPHRAPARGYTRPRRPKAGRLPGRHAHARHAPSGSAAGASRHPHGSLDTPVLLRPSPSQLLTLGLERGMYIVASAARRPGDPATDPHSGTTNHLFFRDFALVFRSRTLFSELDKPALFVQN